MKRAHSGSNSDSMTEKFNYISIARYMAGESSPSERETIEQRIETDPEFEALITDFQKIWKLKSGKNINWDIESTWRSLEEKLNQEMYRDSAEAKKKVRRNRNSRGLKKYQLLRIAAILVITGSLSLFGILQFGGSGEEKVHISMDSMEEVVTDRGQQAEIRLKDGSRIRLNSESRLSHPR